MDCGINMALTDNFQPEQFALRWNNFSHNLSSGFSSHLNTKNLIDVTLAVEGQLLDAHKLVLSVCSPFFENIFKSNPCQHPVVILQDMKYSEVDALVKFMYQGEVNVRHEDLAKFLKAAEVLKVKGLTLDAATLQNSSKTNKNLSQNSNERQIENNNNITPTKEYNKIVQEKKKSGQTHNPQKKSLKRIRKSSLTLSDSTDKMSNPQISSEMKLEKVGTNENKIICTKNNSNLVETSANDNSIDLTKDDDDYQSVNNSVLISTDTINNSSQQSSNIEPVTYRLSARGRPQLVHEGYVYNLTSRSTLLNRSHYRCAEQHRGCRGKCAVMAERFMPTGVNDHNHPSNQVENDYKKKKLHEVE